MAVPRTTGRPAGGLRSPIRGPRPVPAADGERLAAELYREYQRPLLAFALRLTGGDRQWAEDVVQETMIRAWRSRDRLDARGASLMPWLATAARRIVIDRMRYRDVRPSEVGDGPLENVPTADGLDGLLHKVVVADALSALSPAHRRVLTETVLRDRTVDQAADVLAVPVGTVKSRVYYALRALRAALEERGVTA